jgi:peptidoglycan/xylan/chitin deacetylase (PgdA/CDA1 family)
MDLDALDFSISRQRFVLKKVVRRLIAESSAALRPPATEPCIRVLSYHRFGAMRLDPVAVTSAAFDAQLDWLRQHVDILTPARFEAIQRGAEPLRRDAILITIDDGHRSVLKDAVPTLARHAVQAVIFVCPGVIDVEAAAAHEESRQFMSWQELQAVRSLGHTIGPHGLTHRSLGQMPLAQASEEIRLATEALQAHLGGSSPFFAFPYGTREDFCDDLIGPLTAHGYRYCFTSIHGICKPSDRRQFLPRLKIESGERQRMFAHIARGNMDAWRFIDMLGSMLQQRGRM